MRVLSTVTEAMSAPAWISAHLFFGADIYGPVADAVVRDLVAPAVTEGRKSGRILGHFFIRYADLGPHLRVRLLTSGDRVDEVGAWFAERVREVAPGAAFKALTAECTKSLALERWPDDRTPAASAVQAALWLDYVPELERYGGRHGLEVSEKIFEASSDAAIALLSTGDTLSRDARFGRALLLMLATLHVCCRNGRDAADVALRFGKGVLRTILRGQDESGLTTSFYTAYSQQKQRLTAETREIWQALDENGGPPEIHAFSDSLRQGRVRLEALSRNGLIVINGRQAIDWNDCNDRWLPSIIHMTNNRLGIRMLEESYIAFLVAWSFESR